MYTMVPRIKIVEDVLRASFQMVMAASAEWLLCSEASCQQHEYVGELSEVPLSTPHRREEKKKREKKER